METQFLRKTAVIALMTVLAFSLTGAVPLGDSCPVPPPDEYNELQSRCNVTTDISQANASLLNLHNETVYGPVSESLCKTANVSQCTCSCYSMCVNVLLQ